jgi:hypothetical protein
VSSARLETPVGTLEHEARVLDGTRLAAAP